MLIQIKHKDPAKAEYAHLSSGQRAGLKEHGMSARQFDQLDSRAKREWIDELDRDSYAKMRKLKLK